MATTRECQSRPANNLNLINSVINCKKQGCVDHPHPNRIKDVSNRSYKKQKAVKGLSNQLIATFNMKKCFSCTTATSPPTSPEFKATTTSFSTKLRNVSAPFTGSKVRATVRCFRCRRPRCFYSPKPLSSREKKILEDSIDKRVFSCGSSIISPTNFLNEKLSWKTCLTCDDAVETAFYYSNLCLENVCHNCGETGEHVSVGIEHSSSFRLILPVCRQCEMLGIEPKMLMPLSLPNDHKSDEAASSLSSCL